MGQTPRREYEERHGAAGTSLGALSCMFTPVVPCPGLWMKFQRKKIHSTCQIHCFRRSGRNEGAKKFTVHRVPHRLCTSYATYCTGYPQAPGNSGFASRATGASVAGYLFLAARPGLVRFCSPHPAGFPRVPVENLWIVGITPNRAGISSAGARLSGPAGRPGQVAERVTGSRTTGWIAGCTPVQMEDGSFVNRASGPR